MQAQISHNALQNWWQQTNTQRWTVTRQLWVNVFNLLGVIQSVDPVITSLYVDGYHGYHGYQPPTKETPQEMKLSVTQIIWLNALIFKSIQNIFLRWRKTNNSS